MVHGLLLELAATAGALLDATVGSVNRMRRDKPEEMNAAKVAVAPVFSPQYHELRKDPETVANR